MAELQKGDSFRRFEHSVRRKARFVFEDEVIRFMAAVMDTSSSRRKKLKAGTILWRAQLGHQMVAEEPEFVDSVEHEGAYSPERMKPDARFVGDGRVNPRGIPCLYLSTAKNTAMAEVRPWVGS